MLTANRRQLHAEPLIVDRDDTTLDLALAWRSLRDVVGLPSFKKLTSGVLDLTMVDGRKDTPILHTGQSFVSLPQLAVAFHAEPTNALPDGIYPCYVLGTLLMEGQFIFLPDRRQVKRVLRALTRGDGANVLLDQLRDECITDIYSVGATLWHAKQVLHIPHFCNE